MQGTFDACSHPSRQQHNQIQAPLEDLDHDVAQESRGRGQGLVLVLLQHLSKDGVQRDGWTWVGKGVGCVGSSFPEENLRGMRM